MSMMPSGDFCHDVALSLTAILYGELLAVTLACVFGSLMLFFLTEKLCDLKRSLYFSSCYHKKPFFFLKIFVRNTLFHVCLEFFVISISSFIQSFFNLFQC